MESSDGIIDFWILEKRRIIADTEEVARVRLKLTPDQEVISVGTKPIVINRTDPPAADIEPVPEMLSAVTPSFGVSKPERIPRREEVYVPWLKRLRDRFCHMVNPIRGLEEVYPANGHGWDVLEVEPPKVQPNLPDSPEAVELVSHSVSSNGDTAFPHWKIQIDFSVCPVCGSKVPCRHYIGSDVNHKYESEPRFPEGDLTILHGGPR